MSGGKGVPEKSFESQRAGKQHLSPSLVRRGTEAGGWIMP